MIKGHNLKDHMAYFISNQYTNKGLDPNIHYLMEFIISKADQLYMFLYPITQTNMSTFIKGQCIGHMEPSIDHVPHTPVNSITTQKVIDKHVQPDTFTPLLHTHPGNVRKSLNQLLETY